MTPSDTPLEMTGDELRRVLLQVAPKLSDFLDSVQDQPAWSNADDDDAESLRATFREPLPETGQPLEPLLKAVFDGIPAQGFNTTSPGYLAFIPGGGLPLSAVADLIAGIINRYVTVWKAAPVAVEIESTVVRWICDMIGFPASAGGFLTSGGSLANWTAVVTARRCRLPDDFLNGTIYTSDQTHHCVAKAAILAGFPQQNVRLVKTDERFRIDPASLQETIDRDRRAGCEPFLLVGNAGTTNTGAVDDLSILADIAERNRMWFHIDAAYGGFFALTERGRSALRGIDRADSVTLDPHKGLFLPFGTGALIVRRAEDLERAHAPRESSGHFEDESSLKNSFRDQVTQTSPAPRLVADYLPKMQTEADRIDFCSISPELSRDFRGLRLWLPIKVYGIDAFRRQLDEKWDLSRQAAETLRGIAEIEMIAEPQLSLLAFRWKPPAVDDPAVLNEWNRRFLQEINASRRVMLTGTTLHGMFVLRICVLSFRTHADRLEECLDAIRNAVERLESERASAS